MVKQIKKGLEFLSEKLSKAEDVQASVRKYSIPEDDITKGRGGEILVKGASEDAVKALNEALETQGYKGPGLNLEKLVIKAKGYREVNLANLLNKIKEDNKELFDFLRRPKQSIEVMVSTAQAAGFDRIAYKLLKRKPGEVPQVEETLGGLIAMLQLGKQLEDKSKLILKTKDQAKKEEIFKEFKLLTTVQANLTAQVSGAVSEYGRGLGAIAATQKLQNINLSDYTNRIDEFVNNLDDNMIDLHAQTYLSLPSPGRAEYARSGLALRTYDALMELFINGILSSPVTHIVNSAGNALFQVQQVIESGLAGVIGEVRTLGGRRGPVGDRVYKKEFLKEFQGMGQSLGIDVAAESHGMMFALGDAFKGFGSSMVTGEAGDFTSKIDLKNRRAIGRTDNIAHITKSIANLDPMAVVDTLGILGRLPGRLLISEDEFFKVISERAVLYREAYRESAIAYDNARRTGSSKADAKQIGVDKYTETLINPSQTIKDTMAQESKIRTFQNNPEGLWANAVQFVNVVPFMKVIVPFSKTPTNLMKQAFDSTLNWSPIYQTLKSKVPGRYRMAVNEVSPGPVPSGREFDRAMSKLMLGNATFAAMVAVASGQFGDNVKIVGSGPTDPKAQKYLTGQNIERYSINFKQKDGNYKGYTFSRFDPMSAVLSMAADYAYLAQNSTGDDLLELEKVFYNGALALAEYSTNMPFLQGVSEIVKAAGNPYGVPEGFGERMGKFFGKKAGDVVFTATGMVDLYTPGIDVVGATAFSGLMDRIQNPDASSTELSETQLIKSEYARLPTVLKGFYQSYNQAKSRNPNFSKDLPKGLNMWGEVKQQSDGLNYNFVSPIKVSNPQFSKLNEQLNLLSEKRVGTFTSHKTKIGGVQLSAEQINDHILFINNSNKINNNLHLQSGDKGYRPDQTLLARLNSEIRKTDYQTSNFQDRYDRLSGILQDARESGEALLLKKYPSLKVRIDALKD